VDIAASARPALFVPDSISAMQLLEHFKRTRQEIAFVVDEYGEFEGIVTIADVLEALVGDVAVADDPGEHDAVRRDDGSWLIDGGVSIARLKEILAIDRAFPGEDTGTYNTLAGFVIQHLGHIPRVGDHFEWNGLRIEVVDMDRNRVDRLMVSQGRD
jgi:putative hemolysin